MTSNRRAAQRIAVLIDADQVGPAMLDAIMNTATQHGTVVVVRAYRHWSDPMPKGWTDARQKHGLEPVEQAPGPNATDMSLAIDAVDLMHERALDGFVIVSSDRDFAPLAGRIRRGRLRAVLVANAKNGDSEYRKLWDQFVPLPTGAAQSSQSQPSAAKQAIDASVDEKRVKAYQDAIADSDRDGGWARLSDIGKHVPEADRPNTLKRWLQGRPEFEVQKRIFKTGAKETDCVRILPKV